jgi:hypothetical protein
MSFRIRDFKIRAPKVGSAGAFQKTTVVVSGHRPATSLNRSADQFRSGSRTTPSFQLALATGRCRAEKIVGGRDRMWKPGHCLAAFFPGSEVRLYAAKHDMLNVD